MLLIGGAGGRGGTVLSSGEEFDPLKQTDGVEIPALPFPVWP